MQVPDVAAGARTRHESRLDPLVSGAADIRVEIIQNSQNPKQILLPLTFSQLG